MYSSINLITKHHMKVLTFVLSNFLIEITSEYTEQKYSINELRQTLADIYVDIEREYGTESIEWVLRKQQKVEFAAKLHRDEISVDNMVFMDNYYIIN